MSNYFILFGTFLSSSSHLSLSHPSSSAASHLSHTPLPPPSELAPSLAKMVRLPLHQTCAPWHRHWKLSSPLPQSPCSSSPAQVGGEISSSVEELGRGHSWYSRMLAARSSSTTMLAGASSCGTRFGPAPLDLLGEGRCEVDAPLQNSNSR